MARFALICALSLAPLALVGCGGGGGDAEGGGGDDGTGGGEETVDLSAYQGPIASNDVATGEQLYNDVCMACHANISEPIPSLGWEVARMRHQIRNGGDGMPPIDAEQLSDEQMEAVLAFLVTNGGVVDEGGAAPADDMGDDAGGDEPMEGDEGGV